MKIKSIHIAAFGGIKNLDLSLEKPLNVIYGDNEQGKTTVMSFIKMMFYGTERGGTQISKNLRKKYTPWDGSLMAGSIDFEQNGKDYRLERIFGNSNSTDKVTLINPALGERTAATPDVGATLFGLTAAAFERSIFISQFGFPENNNLAEGELQSKLSNIALTGDEDISFEAVNRRLSNALYALKSKSGKSGAYDKKLKAITELEGKLEKTLEVQSHVTAIKQKALTLTEEIKALTQNADKLKTEIESENDYRNAQKLKELLTLKSQLDELNKTITLTDGSLADEVFVRKVEFCLSKTESIKAKIEAKQNEVNLIESNLTLALNPVSDATPEKAEELTKKIKNMDSRQKELSEHISKLEKAPPKKANALPFVLSVLFAAAGAVALLWKLPAGIIGFALAVIFICIGFVLLSKAKAYNEKAKNDILNLKLKETNLISEISAEKSRLTAINAALNSNTAMIENQKEQLKNCKEALLALEAELENESKTLMLLFSTFKVTDNTEQIPILLDGIKQTAAKQKELKQAINYIFKDVVNLSYDEIKAKLSRLNTASHIDFNALKTEYDNLLSSITERKTEAAAILAEVKSLCADGNSAEKLKNELDILKQKTAAQKAYCDSLNIAINVLADSYNEVRKNYGSVLEKKAGEIFAGLTGNGYKNMSISKSFDIAVEKTNIFGSRELDYLSSGTQDQAYLSLRLALSSLIDEHLPIILDDALAQYDDTRAAKAIEFLNGYSQKGQVIMFTCHNSIADTAKQSGANIIALN